MILDRFIRAIGELATPRIEHLEKILESAFVNQIGLDA